MRDYDPVTGRYAESDPLGLFDGPNTYAYAYNPVSYNDPTGQFVPKLLAGAVGGALSDFGIQLAVNGGNLDCVSWAQVGVSGAFGAFGGVGGNFAYKAFKNARNVEYITLYRGIASSHPSYRNGLKGIARPIGGHSNPISHSLGDTKSIYTSWTTEIHVARAFATREVGSTGILLTKKIPVSKTLTLPANIQEIMKESEILISGVVKGAQVIRVP